MKNASFCITAIKCAAPADGSLVAAPGLYWVEKYWLCTGQAGFLVYKYAMRRCEDQAPPPWQVQTV